VVDGAANPYLAAAAMLAAGLDGVARQLHPGPRNDDNLYELSEAELRRRGIGFLPTTLSEAIDELEKDDILRAVLGEEYAACFIRAKRDEWKRYHDSVSAWEVRNYLGLY
jgi:glutamine synthetase